jgi:DNA-binding transcriptional regulator YiaG
VQTNKQINTGAELKTLRQSLGMTQKACADMVYVSLIAWQKWEAGDRPINKTAMELFALKVKNV